MLFIPPKYNLNDNLQMKKLTKPMPEETPKTLWEAQGGVQHVVYLKFYSEHDTPLKPSCVNTLGLSEQQQIFHLALFCKVIGALKFQSTRG